MKRVVVLQRTMAEAAVHIVDGVVAERGNRRQDVRVSLVSPSTLWAAAPTGVVAIGANRESELVRRSGIAFIAP
jgi:hypothetical protein